MPAPRGSCLTSRTVQPPERSAIGHRRTQMNTDKKEARTRIPLLWILSAFIRVHLRPNLCCSRYRNYGRKPKGSPRPAISHLTRNEHSPQCLRLRDEENATGFAKVPLAEFAEAPEPVVRRTHPYWTTKASRSTNLPEEWLEFLPRTRTVPMCLPFARQQTVMQLRHSIFGE